MKKVIILVAFFFLVTLTKAQDVTYNHDASKMNQFTMTELGVGDLTPEMYYTLLHSSYKKSAVGTGKLTYRTAALSSAIPQAGMADSIKNLLEKRALVEALNMADRQNIGDIAWAIEEEKISDALNKYKANIDRISLAGGASIDKTKWEEHYQEFLLAINLTRDSYMPNAERKKTYLNIYSDIEKKNSLLIKYLVYLRKNQLASNMEKGSYLLSSDKSSKATEALSRWKNVSGVVKE